MRERILAGPVRRPVREQPGHLDVRPRVREEGGHRPQPGQRPPELNALLGVARGHLQRPPRETDRRARDRDPEHRERREHEVEAPADLADAGRRVQPRAVEAHRAEDVRCDQLRLGLDRHAVGIRGHEHERVAVRLAAQDRVVAGRAGVGDERLRAVDHDRAALVGDRGRQALEVGAGLGLGDRERREDLAGRDPRQPVRALLVGPRPRQRVAADALHREHRVEVRGHRHELLARHADRDRVHVDVAPAVGCRHRERGQPALAERLVHTVVQRAHGVGLDRHRLDRGGQRPRLLLGLPGRGVELEVHRPI